MSAYYVWPVREDWGLKRLDDSDSHFDYAYSMGQKVKVGDILIFCCYKKLWGSFPVYRDTRHARHEEAISHPDYPPKEWKFVVRLDGTKKDKFPHQVEVESIANEIPEFRKWMRRPVPARNLFYRYARPITKATYDLIVKKAH